MTKQVVNFNAGPAGLPRAVMERARDELIDFEGTGISIMEHSHRGKAYEAVHRAAISLTKELLGVPATHEVLFIQGGASQCFATVPMNFLPAGQSADYVVTGDWSKKALKEAQIVGKARSAGTGEVNGKFVHIPKQSELDLDPKAAYCHITSNNTIAGTQYQTFPNTGSVPLVADMSSDIMWKKIDVSKFHLIYAGAQKNIGPSGVTMVILDKAWAANARKDIPVIFRYQTHLEAESLYNTPPTFGIYMAKLVLENMRENGGLEAVEKRNHEKARILYQAIDNSGGFYNCPVEREARSFMNVVFRLPTEALEDELVKAAEKEGMIGLKGHRSVGGCRASIYNAVTIEGVQRLATFMGEFAKKKG